MHALTKPKYIFTQQGFTFVELIFVVVILGIVASIGSSYLVSTVDTYRDTQARSVLVQRARLAVSQMASQLRMAAPNSVRTSATGACIEFLPTVAGTNYQNQVADANNGMANTATIATGEFYLGLGSAEHVVLAPLYASEIYTSASPAARIAVGSLGSEPITTITLGSAHQFMRNSLSQRVFITDDPVRFCLTSSTLYRYSGYGLLTTSLGDSDPGGTSDILAQGISTNSQLFDISPGSEDRNTAVIIDLVVASGNNSLNFNHEVLIRNVP